jgi:tetratricopeptide (TPR) repeat protein
LREALADYEWVVEHKPQHYQALVHAGALCWQLEQDAQTAEILLTRAARLVPDNKWSYRTLAQIYEATGRTARALQMYRQVLRVDPQDALALQQLKALDNSARD